MAREESNSLRATLAAGDPRGFPATSPGRETTRPLSLDRLVALFGSTLTRGHKPASLRFPRGRKPQVRRPGAFPRRVALAQLQSRGAERPPPPRDLSAASTPASVYRRPASVRRHLARSLSRACDTGSLRRSSTVATSLIHHRRLAPRPTSPSLSPLPSVSKVSAPHLLCCSSFSIP